LTASADKTAKLWDAVSGKLIASFAHEDSVNYAEFSPDGARIVTASADKTAKLWDAASGTFIASFAHPASVLCAVFGPDGSRILTASLDDTAKLWDVASGKITAIFTHRDSVHRVAFNPDGSRVLTASADNSAILWDAATPIELAEQVKESGGHAARMSSSGSTSDSPAGQVEIFSDIASGLHFAEDGSLATISEQRRSQLTQELKHSSQDLYPSARFIRWFFSTGEDRTIFPASDVKAIEWIDNALLTNPDVTEEWLRNALIFQPENALLHIALARFETDSDQASFLRSFGLARLPKNAVICTRAGEMLLQQHQPNLALGAVDTGLLADPTDLAAEHLRIKILDAMVR
jgi:hypothetical protein